MSDISISYRMGDCLDLMRGLDDSSIDLVCTDPPYGYSFMGKAWDKSVPSVDVWKECLRVLKPGAFAFVMSAPRQDVLSRMMANIETAGFDTAFTSLYWTYATGFPKATNISRMVDRRLGAARPRLTAPGGNPHHETRGDGTIDGPNPITQEARALDGAYAGFQPKPAVEVILIAMKPLQERNYVEQALANGKGCTWLDSCRIPYPVGEEIPKAGTGFGASPNDYGGNVVGFKGGYQLSERGRFPANLLVSDNILEDGQPHDKGGDIPNALERKPQTSCGDFGEYKVFQAYGDGGGFSRYFDLDAWFERKIKDLPEEVQRAFPFLICPKADQGEKDRGLSKLPKVNAGVLEGRRDGSQGAIPKTRNIHPTVKPIALMSWLITLGSRPGDLVLDPYLGSGTTLIACRLMMRSGLGFELQQEYEPLIKSRLGHIPAPLEAFQ